MPKENDAFIAPEVSNEKFAWIDGSRIDRKFGGGTAACNTAGNPNGVWNVSAGRAGSFGRDVR